MARTKKYQHAKMATLIGGSVSVLVILAIVSLLVLAGSAGGAEAAARLAGPGCCCLFHAVLLTGFGIGVMISERKKMASDDGDRNRR